jgi:hypothetical protein
MGHGWWGKGAVLFPRPPIRERFCSLGPEKGLKNAPSGRRNSPNRGMGSRDYGDRAPVGSTPRIGASGFCHLHLRDSEVKNRGAGIMGWRGSKLPLICPCLARNGRLMPPIGRRIPSESPDPAVILPR